ncbi:putative transcription factor [Thermochaetoides thermophila DSM 1495]|uniref:Putative transcription factor n=1 Tax=Chaetomium thermophilum (strain DSM 1495 / CBS 144.50 / IMI 039719) TaxID=759272 RepID=G0S5N7_CHATD|nr:putative transcription factor [Thermochaetoides thermophila DSM 1495]EGS20656.1 putative transcription factor [Thermochaetoides thermophila DSM 1495]
MAVSVSAGPSTGSNADNAAASPINASSITAAVSHNSPASVSSPASVASPSSVSTSTTSCSTAPPPIAIRPNPTPKPLSIKTPNPATHMSSNGSVPQGGLSMTTKEWVVPPRPKPGRKPATDTPPTKRKAQNRAAQRAFRERRAARVGELEEQLESEKAAHEKAVRELQERISMLELETQTLQSRCRWLESALERERQSRNGQATTSWDSPSMEPPRHTSFFSPQTQPQPQPSQLAPAAVAAPGMRPLKPAPLKSSIISPVTIEQPKPLPQPFSITQIVSPLEEVISPVDLTCGKCGTNGSCACAEAVMATTDIAIGCGKCTLGSRCQCLEETLGVSVPATSSDLKRPGSPPPTSPEEKRQRSDAGIVMETDFTAIFSSQSNKDPAPSTFSSSTQPLMTSEPPRDPCGFCKEGTYCVCADSMITSEPQPLIAPTQTRTPPPSENDVAPTPMEVTATGAIKLPNLRNGQRQHRTAAKPQQPAASATLSGCGPNGPGTCAQCLADPKSGLFCRSLAANFEKNNPGASLAGGGGGCCGGGGPGGCCKSGNSNSDSQTSTSGFGLSLSCAEAYKTLASHRHFDEAADDIGSWLPKLKALPIPRPSEPGAGSGQGLTRRAPIEVEAASIMSVLKDFDVRFGRGE